MSQLKKSGIGQLMTMLQKHLDYMTSQEKIVDATIAKNKQSVQLLMEAKNKALETEKILLSSIMNDIGEMNTFLRNIVLIENLFNKVYAPYKRKQEAARQRYAKNIGKYEDVKQKPLSKYGSFVQLMFAAQTHVSDFQSWLDHVVRQCQKHKVKIANMPVKANQKKIQRAFYKSFYVYQGQYGFQNMTDVLRCSILFNTFDDLYKCYAIIEGTGGILRVKDRFQPNNIPFGYRDMLINVMCPKSKIVTEIQLQFYPLYKHKKVSHKMYKKARLFEEKKHNLAYAYASQFLRPKLGKKLYQVSPAEMIDDEKEEMTAWTKTFDVLLKEWKLEKFIPIFQDEGWDDPRDWGGKNGLNDKKLAALGVRGGHLNKWKRNFAKWQKELQQKGNKQSYSNATAVVQEHLYGNMQPKMQQQGKKLHGYYNGVDQKYMALTASGWCKHINDGTRTKWRFEQTQLGKNGLGYYITNQHDNKFKGWYLSFQNDGKRVGVYETKTEAGIWKMYPSSVNGRKGYKLKCFYNGSDYGWLSFKNDGKWNYLYSSEQDACFYVPE